MNNNQKFVFAITIIAVFFLSSACNTHEPIPEKSTGKLKLKVGLSIVVNDVGNALKSATVEDLKVEIFSVGSTEAVVSFGSVSEIPDALELSAGVYYATAFSENNPPAAFESPYYYGESEPFTITEGETTQVGMVCSMANIMVTVVYSEEVISFFTDYNTTVGNAEANLVFGKGEERAGYFNAGPLNIESVLTYGDGETPQMKTINGTIASPQVGKHYEIHVDASVIEGRGVFDISLNETIEKEVITITDGLDDDVHELGVGDLLLTEIMCDPDNLLDSQGEWVEVFNNSGFLINLKGLTLRRGSSSTFHQIATDVMLAPGAYAVLGKTALATEQVDYVYGTLEFTNSGDFELLISTYGTDGTDGTVICSVDFGADGFPSIPTGKSIQLDPAVNNVSDAQIGSNWCRATVEYSTGDLGTPGAANSICE